SGTRIKTRIRRLFMLETPRAFQLSKFASRNPVTTRFCRVGGQRVTLAGTFPAARLRTGRVAFGASGSPVIRDTPAGKSESTHQTNCTLLDLTNLVRSSPVNQ